MTAAKQVLLALLGGGNRSESPGSQVDWTSIAEMAAAHRLEPLLAWQSETRGWTAPAPHADRWNQIRRDAALTALAQQAALRLAHGRLEAAGIRTVALKGVPLAWRYYPEPGLRPMRDIDLLVAEDHALAAAADLSDAGFAMETHDEARILAALTDDHQLPAQHHSGLGVTLELHHRLTDPQHRRGYALAELDASAMLAQARPLDCGGTGVLCPTPEHLAAHLIVHALYGHRLDCGPLVLADLHFIAAAVNWSEVRRAAERGGWLRGLDLLLALTEKWFGPVPAEFAAPPDTLIAAAEDALLPSLDGRHHAAAMADLTGTGGSFPAFLKRRLMPDAHVVATEGRGLPTPLFWPLWAARRAGRLASNLTDRRVRHETRSAVRVVSWLEG